MVQLCRIICVIISVLSWYLPGIPVSAIWSPAHWTASLHSDSWLALTGNCRKNYSIVSIVFGFQQSHHHKLPWVLRGVSSRPSSYHPCYHCHLQWVFDKETFCYYEPEVWGAESWHLMISSFWLDPGNWLNLCQIIKTHNGKCHATEESWGAFTGLPPSLLPPAVKLWPSLGWAHLGSYRYSGSHGRQD